MVFLVVIFFMSVSFAPLSASQREAYRIPPRRPAFSYHLRGESSGTICNRGGMRVTIDLGITPHPGPAAQEFLFRGQAGEPHRQGRAAAESHLQDPARRKPVSRHPGLWGHGGA